MAGALIDTRMIVDSIPEAHRKESEALIAVGRRAEPGEIAAGVMYLASPEAAHVTGGAPCCRSTEGIAM